MTAYSVQFNPRALLVTGASLVLLWLALTQGFSLLTIAIDVAVGWGLWAVPANWPQKGRQRADQEGNVC